MQNTGFDKTIVATARLVDDATITAELRVVQKGILVGTPVLWPNYDYILFQAGVNDADPDTIVCLFES